MDYLLKSEPSTYSFADLQREKSTIWDGVSNPVALKNMRAMKPGDRLVIYHTGDERQIIGTAEVASDPYPDPRENDPKLVVIDLKPRERLPRPVTLAEIKARQEFRDFELVRMGRLSVMPISDSRWQKLCKMAARS